MEKNWIILHIMQCLGSHYCWLFQKGIWSIQLSFVVSQLKSLVYQRGDSGAASVTEKCVHVTSC